MSYVRQSDFDSLVTDRALLQAVWEHSSHAMVLSDLRGTILRVNPAWLELGGYSSGEALGKPLTLLFSEESRQELAARFHSALAVPVQIPFEARLKTSAGQDRRVEVHFALLQEAGRPAAILSRLRDLAGQESPLEASLENEVRHRIVVEMLKHLIEIEKIIASISTFFISLKPSQTEQGISLTLEKIGEFVGVDRSYVFLFSEDGARMDNTHEWCAAGISPQKAALQGLLLAEYPWLIQQLQRRENVLIPRVADLPAEAAREKETLEMQDIRSVLIVPLVYGDAVVGFLGFDCVQAEFTWLEEDIVLLHTVGEILANALERKRAVAKIEEQTRQLQIANAMLEKLSITDTLTETKNRRAFMEHLDEELRRSERSLRPLSLLLLDVDEFKQINDTFGHLYGDEVIKGVARLLLENVRATDFLARYGGDEFAVILPDTDPEGAILLAERSRQVVEAARWPRRLVTLSIGATTYAPAAAMPGKISGSALMAQADKALYAAKNGGRNRAVHAWDLLEAGQAEP